MSQEHFESLVWFFWGGVNVTDGKQKGLREGQFGDRNEIRRDILTSHLHYLSVSLFACDLFAFRPHKNTPPGIVLYILLPVVSLVPKIFICYLLIGGDIEYKNDIYDGEARPGIPWDYPREIEVLCIFYGNRKITVTQVAYGTSIVVVILMAIFKSRALKLCIFKRRKLWGKERD